MDYREQNYIWKFIPKVRVQRQAIKWRAFQHGNVFMRWFTTLNLLIILQTSEQFLDLFRNNLLDVRVNSLPYGTHSFRRGGCQYLASGRRWSLRRICEWGGWSVEFSNLTIVRYLISWNDNPTEGRESYFHPARQVVLACSQCGRSCPCGA